MGILNKYREERINKIYKSLGSGDLIKSENGRWITTEDGNRAFLGGDGKLKYTKDEIESHKSKSKKELGSSKGNGSVDKVIDSIKSDPLTYNKNDTEELKDKKIINRLKEKRNTKSGAIKQQYAEAVSKLEKEYSEKHGDKEGKDINDVKEKDLEILPTTDQEEAEATINTATPENRNKVAKQLFGKPKEEEPTEKQKEKEVKSNEDKKKLVKKTSFTTPTGIKLNNILDFTEVKHGDILLSDMDTILEKEKPYYIPDIDEKNFKNNAYVLDFVKIDENQYLVANNGFSKPYRILDQEKVALEDENYSMVTPEVLLVTQEYYRDKEKANITKKNKESFERNMESFNKIPEESRAKYTPPKQKRATLSGVLKGSSITASYFKMYKKFRNEKYAVPIRTYLKTDEAAMDFNEVRKILDYKKNDMDRQKEDHSNTFKKGQETSYGDTNLNDRLMDSHGVKIKMQNGKDVDAGSALEIKKALSHVYDTFGDRSSMAKNFGLKISHSGEKKMHASKAIGVYVPSYKTIGVSSHYGEHKFGLTLGHEFAHFMDNYAGEKRGRYFASDDYGSTAGRIANEFRDNMNKASDSGYMNRTAECFARALEQYHAFKVHGEGAVKIDSRYADHSDHVSADKFKDRIAPLIEQFLNENDKILKSITFSFDKL